MEHIFIRFGQMGAMAVFSIFPHPFLLSTNQRFKIQKGQPEAQVGTAPLTT